MLSKSLSLAKHSVSRHLSRLCATETQAPKGPFEKAWFQEIYHIVGLTCSKTSIPIVFGNEPLVRTKHGESLVTAHH